MRERKIQERKEIETDLLEVKLELEDLLAKMRREKKEKRENKLRKKERKENEIEERELVEKQESEKNDSLLAYTNPLIDCDISILKDDIKVAPNEES